MMDELRFDAGTIAASYTTPDGWERVYLRLARPDWDYKYFNRDGTSRIEVISPEKLFDKASTDTAKMIPLGIGHPATRRVDSFNIDHYIKGSTGHTVLREKTPDGEFLGITATIFSEQAKQAARQFPGVSPGYSVKIARSDSSRDYYQRYDQSDRYYNHGAVGVIPRGGADVRSVFEGLRIDSADDDNSPIWVATLNNDCYASPIDAELILPLLERSDAVPGMAEKTKVDLGRYKLNPKSIHMNPNDDEDDEDDEDKDDNKEMKDGRSKKSDRKDEACGPGCECENCSPNKKKKRSKAIGFGKQFQRKDDMSVTSFVLDGVTYQEIPIAFAQAITPIVKRADEMSQQLSSFKERVDGLKTELTEAQERADSLSEDLEAAQERVDELEKAEPDENRMDEDEAVGLAMDIAATVDQMRSDGLMLQELGLVENFNTDFAYIAENMAGLQREMLGVASPNQRIDGYNDRDAAIAYDTAMGSVRLFAEQRRVDAENAEEGDDDRQDMYYPSMGRGRSKPMLNHGLPTLHKIGQMSKPMKPTNQTVRSLINRFTKMEDSVFQEASNTNNQMQLQHPMAARIM